MMFSCKLGIMLLILPCVSFQFEKINLQSHEQVHSSFYEQDLTEIILILGHSDAFGGPSNQTMDLLGWEFGIKVTHVSHPENCYADSAISWKKGKHCVAAFQASDDTSDAVGVTQGIDGTDMNTTEFCGFDINPFLREELIGLQSSSEWKAFLDYFIQPDCETVTAAGHSLGGSVATVFAACTNVKQYGFGNRNDFGLATFGNYPTSKEPLYSGTPGIPFRGTRYHVSGLDGNLDSRSALPKTTKEFRFDILTLYSKIAEASGAVLESESMKMSAFLISILPEMAVEEYWVNQHIFQLLRPFHRKEQMIVDGLVSEPELQSLRSFSHKFAMKLAARGDLFYYFDPISVAYMEYGYKHALVDYQPISHPMLGLVPLPRISADRAFEFPKADYNLVQLGSRMMQRIPNHLTCCYFRGEGCIYLYDPASWFVRGCPVALER